MKHLVIHVLILLSIAKVYCQKVYKLEDKNLYLKIFDSCNCGDYIIDDTTKLYFSLVVKEERKTLLVWRNNSKDVVKYIIMNGLKKVRVNRLISNKRKSKSKVVKVKYFSAFKEI